MPHFGGDSPVLTQRIPQTRLSARKMRAHVPHSGGTRPKEFGVHTYPVIGVHSYPDAGDANQSSVPYPERVSTLGGDAIPPRIAVERCGEPFTLVRRQDDAPSLVGQGILRPEDS